MLEQNPTSFPSSTNEPFQKSNWLIWTSTILILLLVSAGTYYIGFMVNKNKNAQIQSSPSPFEQPKESTPPIESITPITDPGVTWLAKPEKLENLNLFNTQYTSADYINYYKIAETVDGGQIISAQIQEMGIRIIRFKKDTTGIFSLLVRNSSFSSGEEKDLLNNEKYTKELIRIDWNVGYDSLAFPQILTFQGKQLKTYGRISGEFYDDLIQNYKNSNESNPAYQQTFEEIGETPYGTLYKNLLWYENSELGNNPKIKRISYILKLADTSTVYYSIKKDVLGDDGTIMGEINTDSQTFKSKKFTPGILGSKCGLGSNDQIYIDTLTTDKLKLIGKTPSGGKLYTITDPESDIIKTAYQTYKIGRDNDNNLLSYETFATKKPVLIWPDPFGNYLLFLDIDYAPLAECGKPVIYLYPEKATAVSVKVGADIRISEPAYNSGWQVTANPGGSIINQDGKIYDSLYWEGLGHGFYPTVISGRVVASKNITTELKKDLATLGLNQKEANDFMAFWLPKMPKTPYIRLTWLDTHQMNILAPLNVSPRPDTIVRVFLDFQGQDNPETNLAPQKLISFKRKGFTLVEWGGLLIGK